MDTECQDGTLWACYVARMLHEGSRRGPQRGSARRGFGRLRKLPSKRWQAAYTGPDGIVYSAQGTFEYEDAARGWLHQERRLIEDDEWLPPPERVRRRVRSRETVQEFADGWLNRRQSGAQPLKPRTSEHYRRILDSMIFPSLGSRPLSTLTATDVEEWYHSLNSNTPTYRAHAYGLLRTIIGSVDATVLPSNPVRIKGAGNSRRQHEVVPLTLAELATLTAAMPVGRRPMVLMAAWCALRFGELTELRRRDFDLVGGVVKIRRGVVRTAEGRVVGTPKSSAGSRDVAIPPHLLPVLADHLVQLSKSREALLFPSAAGGHLASATFYGKAPRLNCDPSTGATVLQGGHGFYRARVEAGRPDLHFHDLRHTGAVLAAQTGATLAELMMRLGHSTPGAAMRYQHAARGRDHVIASALSQMVSLEPPK